MFYLGFVASLCVIGKLSFKICLASSDNKDTVGFGAIEISFLKI